MIIVKLIGGLGNQMFQYAVGRHLALKTNTELKIDISGFKQYKLHKFSLDTFNIEKNIASKKEVSTFKKYQRKSGKVWFLYNRLIADKTKYFQERQFNFDPEVLSLKDPVYLDGYWQTKKYFEDIEPVIRKDFSFILPQGDKDKAISELINNTDSVSVHIRRADYVTDKNSNESHGTCHIEYYEKAINIILEKVSNPHFFIFSDDHKWVKENIKIKHPTVYVDHNNADTNYQDLHLMSICKNNIVANSSFSWWGAWLNSNPNKIVIAPQRWFLNQKMNTCDLIPDSWIKI